MMSALRKSVSIQWMLFFLFLIGIVAVGCGKKAPEAVVTRRDITTYLSLDGKISVPAAADARLVSPYDAPIGRIYTTVGQKVRRGEVVFDLSAPVNQAYYQQAQVRLKAARDQLAQAQANYRSSVVAAQKQLEKARQAERAARKAAGTTAIDPTITQNRIIAEQAVLDAQAQMESGLVPYQRQVAAAEDAFEAAQGSRKITMIRTPISGTVLSINTKVGEMASRDAKDPLARIVDLDALEVYASVDANQINQVKAESPVIIKVKEVPEVNFPGSVRNLYSEKAGFLQGASYVAVIDFKNIKGQAKPDMDATASIQTGKVKDVLAVPVDAVSKSGERSNVKVKQGRNWVDREVETGLSDGKWVEIRSGLKEGDVVQVNTTPV